MQQFGPGGSTLYEDGGYFGRSEAGFSIDDNTAAGCAGFLGLDECLDRHLMKSSGLTPLIELNANGDSIIGHDQLHQNLDFELEDNGQLLHDMLQQQQQQIIAPNSSPTQQQSAAAASWEESIHVLQEMLLLQQHQALQCPPIATDHPPSPASFPSSIFTNPVLNLNNSTINNPANPKFPGESELLSLLQLPRCASSSMPSSTDQCRKLPTIYNPSNPTDPLINYHNPSINYDPHQLLQQQQQQASSSLAYPVSLKHLLHNLPPTHANASTSSTLVHHLNDGEEIKEPTTTFNIEEGRQFTSPLFDFKRDNAKGEPRGINHFATERQRREYLNEKYQTLRSLVPNPTKADRASIVQDAIEYVKELKRTVQELQMLMQEKGRQQLEYMNNNNKKRKLLSAEESMLQGGGAAADVESSSYPARGIAVGDSSCGLLRSSLLQRTSQHGTHVDVRIVEEEVNIKLTQKKKKLPPSPPPPQHHPLPRGNPLLLDIVATLHDLHLDLLSANGATIGDHHVFMLNTKIMEGSSTFAGQVATKLIEAVDRQFCNNYLQISY